MVNNLIFAKLDSKNKYVFPCKLDVFPRQLPLDKIRLCLASLGAVPVNEGHWFRLSVPGGGLIEIIIGHFAIPLEFDANLLDVASLYISLLQIETNLVILDAVTDFFHDEKSFNSLVVSRTGQAKNYIR